MERFKLLMRSLGLIVAAGLLFSAVVATDTGVSAVALPLHSEEAPPIDLPTTDAEQPPTTDSPKDSPAPEIEIPEEVDESEEPTEKAPGETTKQEIPWEESNFPPESGALSFGTTASTSAVSGFKAGYIISDANFYDGNAMTAAQVQSFLNQRVSGTAPRSLKTLRHRTLDKPASKYCNRYSGQSSETAAQIIAKVGKSCGISQRVILATLQKEQGLVTKSSPSDLNYERSMGYSCPDTAPCDIRFGGFFNQVWHGSQRFKEYRDISWAKKPGRNYVMAWSPEAKCKKSTTVHIENWATAALYTYTPYPPNQASLNAYPGTGDECSSYGNRNFYASYKLWFGSPNTFFPDVSANHKFFTEIEWMGKEGLSTGVRQSNGGAPLYKPYDRVTREAMAAFLYRAENASYSPPPVSPFADMKPGDKFYREITWMHKEGLSTGISQGKGKKPIYAPKDRVSREAMAAFLYRMDEANYSAPATSPFTDMRRGDKFYREITWMHKERISTGISQGKGKKPKYAPKDRVSREAMAAFIYRYHH